MPALLPSVKKSLVLSQLLAAPLSFVTGALAQVSLEWEDRCFFDEPLLLQRGETLDVGPVATIEGFECILANILITATTFIGLAAFVMFIIAAFLYLTSGSSPKGAEAARQTFTYAIIGIIVALLATFILSLIVGFTGVQALLRFDLFLEN